MKITGITLPVSLSLWLGLVSAAQAESPTSATLAGTMQSELGCPGDWQPACATTHLTKNGTEWSVSFTLPAGSWEYKIALNDSWTESYGYNLGSANATFTLSAEKSVTFKYDELTHRVTDNAYEGAPVPADPQPVSVTIAGNLQSALGCAGDWTPACTETQLALEDTDKVWQKSFTIPAGDWQYKAALDGGWTENYGRNAAAGGENIAIHLDGAKDVKFYYSHKSHWIASGVDAVIATAVGNFQAALGCPGDWQPDCLLSWLQDADGNGLYTYATTALPVGQYEAKVALDEAWNESYGGDGGSNIAFAVSVANQKVVFTYDAAHHQLYIGDEAVAGDVRKAKAYWLARDTLAMDLGAEAATATVKLHYAADGGLSSSPAGVGGGESLTLTYEPAGLGDAVKAKFRHLAHLPAFKIAAGDLDRIKDILKQQSVVSATNSKGNLLDATALQTAGVLDELYANDGALGLSFEGGVPSVRLWAPTAKSVSLLVYAQAEPASTPVRIPMSWDAATGVWSVTGEAGWKGRYYLYEVEVYARHAGGVVRNRVADPYSVNTSPNGGFSQFVDLNDAALKPEGWDLLAKPVLAAPEDIAVYELHLRDFSIGDTTVPEAERGSFAAFTHADSQGMKHLKALAEAGLSHVHLLPAFDCATINEHKAEQAVVADNLAAYAPDGEEQQAAVDAVRGQDGFNWCYDPHHYTVPEGSYSTTPDGTGRIVEFRKMVAALNQAGLRVVMDVVYNHTSGSLQGETSVLDKVVPDYYHRLNAQGEIETSTCCANTASEHAMMEKLMRDSLTIWATQYKVDGFRFDIMGHHSKDNILAVKHRLQALTPEKDGVNGSQIYLYGEGWNFGEVVDDKRFTQARLGNMSGTGVGVFNNFMRDAVRGGGPFDAGIEHVQHQSIVNGLYLNPNAENSASAEAKAALLKQSDLLRVALAGSLADYTLVDRTGASVKASSIDGAGFTQDPQETINYIEAHDNETLFDMLQYKAPLATTMSERVRMQNLANSFLLMAQGVPFLHAGQELLRSKSMDRNSYDSGDWFNVLDFTYQDNGWGRGLPRKADNEQNWSVAKPRLADLALKPGVSDIVRARDHLIELLKIRKGSPLFRLGTATQIQDQVVFYNTGADQVPGLIAMLIKDTSANTDPALERILVVFNANTTAKSLTIAELAGWDFSLHAVQRDSTDAALKQAGADTAKGTFTVPAYTTAVFVATKKGETDGTPAPAPAPTPGTTSDSGGGSTGVWLLGGLWAMRRLAGKR